MASPYTSEFYDRLRGGSLCSAQEVVPLVIELTNPTSVVDVGCGDGSWLSVFKKHGVVDVLGIDGSHRDVTKSRIQECEFKSMDLGGSIDAGRRFDLAVSIEVAEHLAESDAGRFVATLVALAPVVLFSAAVPMQGGEHHVNEQWPDYWRDKFQERGFIAVDCLRGRVWNNSNVKVYYRQNMVFFVDRERLAEFPKLEGAYRGGCEHPLSVVHPDLYLARSRYALDTPVVGFLKRVLPDWAIRVLTRI